MCVREEKGGADKLRCPFIEGVAGTASRRGSSVGAKPWTTPARSQRGTAGMGASFGETRLELRKAAGKRVGSAGSS